MIQVVRVVAVMATTFLVSACGWIADKTSDQTTTAGPKPLSTDYEEVHLPFLLDPDGRAKEAYGAGWDALSEGKKIDLAIDAFHTMYPPETERDRRDQVQERLLGISNQMCSRYLSYMQNINSDGNFVLGSLATIAGAAGAIFSGGTSQILAGTAGALSGVRAEFNQDYFSNLTVAVITSGINLKRQEIYDEIVRYGANRDERHYSVEAAIKDALFYHGECSLMAGVEKAGDAIKLAQDPGLDAVNRTLLKVNQMRMIAQEQVTDPADVPGMGSNTIKLLQAGKPTGGFAEEGLDELPNMTIGRLKLRAAKLAVAVTKRIDAISNFANDQDKKTVRDAINATETEVDKKIDTCAYEAGLATTAIVNALGVQAAANDDTQRKSAERGLEAALFSGNAVNAKAQIPVDIFAQNLSKAIADLEEASRKAQSKGAAERIGASTIAGAKTLIEAAKTTETRCTPKPAT